MFRRIVGTVLSALALVAVHATAAHAGNFSFTGTFTQDDNVQLFSFTVGAPSVVTLRTWSYAGGTNAAGDTIARGGFDPILALFDSTGNLVGQNDDGGCGFVSPDSVTTECWDTFFSSALVPGDYQVSVMEYNNFANGPNISNGFVHSGGGNFTGALANCAGSGRFEDVSNEPDGCQRDGHWAFDILNVAQATVNPNASAVPEPGSLALAGSGLVVLARRLRNRV